MKDFVTARERLADPRRKKFVNDFVWTMLSVGMMTMMFILLLKEVNYVN